MATSPTIKINNRRGVVLMATMMIMALLMSFLAAYGTLVNMELKNSQRVISSSKAFHIAEAGANLRAETLRADFSGFSNGGPNGTSPLVDYINNQIPCIGSNVGSDSYRCRSPLPGGESILWGELGGKEVQTYVLHDPLWQTWGTLSTGRFRGLSATTRPFEIMSVVRNPSTQAVEARIKLTTSVKSIPLFQFAAFYENDLEYHPGQAAIISGPIFSNGNIFFSSEGGLTLNSSISSAGTVYAGENFLRTCPKTGAIRMLLPDGVNYTNLNPCVNPPGLSEISPSVLAAMGGRVMINQPRINVPTPASLNIGGAYWDSSVLRIALEISGGLPSCTSGSVTSAASIYVYNQDQTPNQDLTNALTSCAGTLGSVWKEEAGHTWNSNRLQYTDSKVVGFSNTFYDLRENTTSATMVPVQYASPGKSNQMLEVDVQGLLNCIHQYQGTAQELGRLNAPGGLMVYLTVKGDDSSLNPSFYGVRLRNGRKLQATTPGAATLGGLSFISDQAIYVMGDYNSQDKIPAALMGDTIHVLSNNWCNSTNWSNPGAWSGELSSGICDRKLITSNATLFDLIDRPAALTEINAATISGQDDTIALGRESGGVHNFFRLHENWQNIELKYAGSMVSFGSSQHSQGPSMGSAGHNSRPYYAPIRNFNFETMFTDRRYLPPGTPEVSYIGQLNFDQIF
jgi:hypothetical protein